jgi:predicted RNA-binding Zn ribbon-like protein
METDGDVTRMRLVGGNLALDFLNTRVGPPAGPPDDDVLSGYAELVDWARYAGGLTDEEAEYLRRRSGTDPDEAGAAFARALRIRDRLDVVFRPLADGRDPEAAALTRLRDDAADAHGHAELVPGQPFSWSWSGDRTLGRPLRPVVHAAVELLTTGRRERIKGCAGCSFLFYDESKNRSRRWCSMDDCGTAEKVRRYVVARRTRRAEPSSR